MSTKPSTLLWCCLALTLLSAPAHGKARTVMEAYALLHDFATRFSYRIEEAAYNITSQADDRRIRRDAVVFKMRTIQKVTKALLRDEPRDIAIDQFTLCVQLRQYLTDGAGKDVFGQWQQIMIDAVKGAEADMISLGESQIGKAAMDKAREDLEAFVKEYPLTGPLVRSSARPNINAKKPQNWDLAQNPLFKLPLAPLTHATGLDKTTQQMAELELALARASAMLDILPARARWETELLMYDAEDRITTRELVKDFNVISENIQRFTDIAQKYPDQIRQSLVETMKEADASQAGLQKTLAESRTLVGDVQKAIDKTDTALGRVDGAAKALEGTADSVTKAGAAWEATAKAIGELIPEDAEPSEGSEFDINDYTKAAEAWTTTATELREAVAEVRALAADEQAGTVIEAATSHAIAASDYLSTQLMWRGMLLIVVALIAAMVYRVFSLKLQQRMMKPAG